MKFILIFFILLFSITVFGGTPDKAKIYIKKNYPNAKSLYWVHFKEDSIKYHKAEFENTGRVVQIEFFENGDINYIAEEMFNYELPDSIKTQLINSRIFFATKIVYFDDSVQYYVNAERKYKVDDRKIEEYDIFFDSEYKILEDKTTMLRNHKEGIPHFFRITYIILLFYFLFTI